MNLRSILLTLSLSAAVLTGCTSTKTSNTARTAKEQLLISNSVDQSLNRVDFKAFRGQSVFLDEKYLEAVDKNYIVSSLRHRVLTAGAQLVDKKEDATVVLEARSGGVGTDTTDMFLGMPGIQLPGPVPISLPEIKVVSKSTQTGTAKIGLVAYDAKSNTMLGDGGVALARSDDNNWYVLGVGPFQNGSVRREVRESSTVPVRNAPLSRTVAFRAPGEGGGGAPQASDVQYASGLKDNGEGEPRKGLPSWLR